MSEFESQNNEAINLVRDGQQLPRAVCHFVPDAEYRKLKRLEKEAMDADEYAQQNAWRAKATRFLTAIARASCGFLFIAGAAEGLMDLTFAAMMTAGVMIWGLCGYFWSRGHE